MNRPRQLLVALALAATAAGCELITHIDPSTLPGMDGGGTGGTTMGTGGTGGTGTTSVTTGTGGTGGAQSSSGTGGGCSMDTDCPASTNVCVNSVCSPTSHTCAMVDVPNGGDAAASAQTKGSCKKVVCDGSGHPMSTNDDTNIPDDGEVCTTDGCMNGTAVHTPNTMTCTENGGKVCGDPTGTKAGKCVACNIDSDCGGSGICQSNHCVTGSCNDMVKDQGETDVDCGGSCAPCGDHLGCKVDADCQSDICGPTLTCTPASCSDNKENEGETDVDCGGPVCRPTGKLCDTGKGCAIDGDCQSLDCNTMQHLCLAPTCFDGIQNQGETDIDCGGPNCSGCANGKKCSMDSDCASMGCSSASSLCVPQCQDGHKDGVETDVDCGGLNGCPRCAVTKACFGDTDCVSNACDGISLVCDADQCADHRKDGVETDVDCGGGTCSTCALGQKCLMDADCTSTGCQTFTHLCVTPCTDGHVDGVETDIDCGGGTCPKCVLGKICKVDADCTSGGCQSTGHTCVTPCTDGHQDFAETDVDCGGGACSACATGLKCLVDADCVSQACDAISLTCVSNPCADHRLDGVETDVDCGGPNTCPRCAVGQICVNNTDCMSQACDAQSNTCATDTCSDHHQDGNETDKDCGGGTCPACALNKGCSVDTDCASNACDAVSMKCVSNQCADHRQDGAETDVDCGGGTCSACGLTQKCSGDADCNSNACDAISLTCVANQCADHRRDGAETDVDCGGGTCPTCGVGLKCGGDADCFSQACDAVSNLCVANQCADHQQDGVETDVDCGGGTCPTCALGLKCGGDADCASNACDAMAGVCVADQCADHRKDGAESDVDCGGGTCPTCGLGLKCGGDADCTSNACDGVSGLCVNDQCADHREDGVETDVDCGGGTCSTCAVGQKCLIDADCTSTACDALSNKCVSSECIDHQQDGAETDVDCGGGTCLPCGLGLKCNADADCSTNACDALSNKCVTGQCIDHQQDGAETDVDCGGGTCFPCGLGLKCNGDTDCFSNACDASSGLCISDQCADNRKDGAETDVDCGGGTCPTCGLGFKCGGDTDCTSNACDALSGLCVSDQCADNRKDGAETDVDCGGGTCSPCGMGQGCNNDGDCASPLHCNGSNKCT